MGVDFNFLVFSLTRQPYFFYAIEHSLVINDSCYASVLDAGHLSSEPSHSSFIYRTFSLEDSATTTQTITCILKLCMDGFPCKRAAADTDCPTGDGNENFLYTLSGVEYGPDDNRL